MDYLKKLEQPSTELQEQLTRQRAERQINPEEAEQRAEKQRRANEQMAAAARGLSTDPEVLALNAIYAAERQNRDRRDQEETEDVFSTEPDYLN